MSKTEFVWRAEEYAKRYGLVIGPELGSGLHGIVFSAESQSSVGRSALKVHERKQHYRRERDVYLRLKELGVTAVCGCNVPELLGWDDALWVIEMTVVTRPFVLDFAGAYLDTAPDYPEEVLADWRAEKQEQFGPHWREVQAVLSFLERHGVFLADVNPGNISFDG